MADPSRYRPVDRILYALLALYSGGVITWLVWASRGSRQWFFESIFLVGGLLPGIAACLLIAYQVSAADRRRGRFSPTATLVSLAVIILWFLAVWFVVAGGTGSAG